MGWQGYHMHAFTHPLRSGTVGELLQMQRAKLRGDVDGYRVAVLRRQLFRGGRFGLARQLRMGAQQRGRDAGPLNRDNASRAGVFCTRGMVSSFQYVSVTAPGCTTARCRCPRSRT